MYDIVTIGSGTVDVFVDTDKKELRKHQGHEDVCYGVGSKQLIKGLTVSTGGGGTNTAVAFSRYGLKTGWVGAVGDDVHGCNILDNVKKEGVDFLGAVKKGHSGYSVILVGLHHDRSILAYKGVNDTLRANDIKKKAFHTKWFYIGSMMGNSFDTAVSLVKQARAKGIRYAYNPSTYQSQWGLKRLAPLLSGCDLLVLNKEEANLLCKTKGRSGHELFPVLTYYAKRVIITDGARGAEAFADGTHYMVYADKSPVVETTGAGDAFASGVLCGLIDGWDFASSLRIGYAQATSVLRAIGAKNILLDKKALIARAKKQKIKVQQHSH
ncbi:MAG TPA: carbohydrate kinase family protein [Candidatus Nanoarchaeia archaeon]|nr:carbohydrate kinase family protein [Candidatus Nanoarchaeia archaeon]